MTKKKKEPEPESEFKTTDETCEYLKVNIDTLLSHIHSGDLKAINVGTGSRTRWRIAKSDIQAFLDSRSNQHKSKGKRKSCVNSATTTRRKAAKEYV